MTTDAATNARSARAIINLDVEGPVISRHVYGHFAEHLGRGIYGGIWVGEDSEVPSVDGIRRDVVEALRELRVPNLRWPGGCFADEYHWRDGVGPRASRPRMVNTSWGDVEEDNHFGTHEFMQLCELLGAEPYVNGNLGSGTVQEMSEWVEYLTRDGASPMVRLRKDNGRDAPWRVPFWGLGNEAWGCGGNMRAEHYADLARQFSTYCRNHGDNVLYRIAAGAGDADYAWTETLMKSLSCLGCGQAPRGYFQGISLHYYTIPGTWEAKGSATDFDIDDYYRTMVKARHIDELVTRHSAVMECYDPDARVGLVVDEWGTWWDPTPGTDPGFLEQQNTLRDALVASVHLDVFHKHARRVVMANLAQTVNVLQAVLLTDGGHLVRTPTYHVFEMSRDHQDAASRTVHVQATGTRRAVGTGELDTLSVSASVKDGHALVSLTNLDADAALPVTLDLRGGTAGEQSARILTAPTTASHNTATAPGVVQPEPFGDVERVRSGFEVTLPPHAFVTVRFALSPSSP